MDQTSLLIGFIALVLGSGIGFIIKNYLIARETDKKQTKASH